MRKAPTCSKRCINGLSKRQKGSKRSVQWRGGEIKRTNGLNNVHGPKSRRPGLRGEMAEIRGES
jgi:hypothetical protein